MKLKSGEFAKTAASPIVESIQALFENAARSNVGQELRQLAVNPLLRQQGEFMAGSGRGLSDVLSDWAQQAGATGMSQRLIDRPISDNAVALGAGGLGGLLGGRLLYGGPGE